MIDFNAIEYMSAIWFVRGDACDWMAVLFKPLGGGNRWHLSYRFRYYSGSLDPFDDSDRKSEYTGSFDNCPGEAQALERVDLVAADVASRFKSSVDRVDVRGGLPEFLAAAGGRPWLHIERRPIS